MKQGKILRYHGGITLERKVIVGSSIAFILIIYLLILTQRNRNEYYEQYRAIEHSYETLNQIQNIIKSLLMREDSHHHFLTYYAKEHLDKYNEHNTDIEAQLKKLALLVNTLPQQHLLDSLQKLNYQIITIYKITHNPNTTRNKTNSSFKNLNQQGEITQTERLKYILHQMEQYEKNAIINTSASYTSAVNKTSLSFYSMVYSLIALTILLFFFIMSDFKKRKETERKLIENEKLLDAIFNESEDSILLADEGLTRLEKYNKTAAAKFNLEDNEAKESLLSLFQKRIFGSDNLVGSNKSDEETASCLNEFEFNQGNYKYFWGSVSIIPILRNGSHYKRIRVTDISDRKIAEKNAIEYTHYLKDNKDKLEKVTTELLKANNELKKSKIELNQLNANKDKFLSIIAHDLRSPLSGIIGISEFLVSESEGIKKDELKECSESINRTAKNIHRLLNNLLDWARIQSGRMEFKPAKFNIWILAEELTDLTFQVSNSKNITIKNYIDKSLNVFADYNMVSTILRNLMSNAIKYTNPGGHIIIDSQRKGEETVITVKDSGTGMSESTISSLFQIDKGHSMEGTAGERGTGLGLILCKELVFINKGNIWVKSSLNSGSEFSFTLPAINEETRATF